VEKNNARNRAYARRGDLVFLLDAATTGRALAEYRNRKVWGPSAPDAAQVEKVRFGSAKNSFVIEKVGNGWQIAGKPMAKVNADAVRDALDALAGLQAERFATDKAEDLKLYGLEPPALIIDLETAVGKRTLHVGRQEGGSERYYALVPGEGAAVFVLGTRDAQRIVRTLEDYLAHKP